MDMQFGISADTSRLLHHQEHSETFSSVHDLHPAATGRSLERDNLISTAHHLRSAVAADTIKMPRSVVVAGAFCARDNNKMAEPITGEQRLGVCLLYTSRCV